jgi:transposase
VARAGAPPPGADASFPGYLATRRIEEVGTVDPVIAEQLGRTHPLARHLDHFLTDLANAGTSAHTRRAYGDDLPGISSFARGLENGLAAVTAGLSTSWNSGPVEGNVNRIKMIKRQMFGRADLDLLRKRILHAA